MYRMRWDFPDTEETKNMVYAVSCEILCHFAETLLPPLVVVLFHYLPIIGGKAPVLSVHGECVGWCACLTVHVEIIRLNPCLHAVAADADRDITFKDNTFFAGIVSCIK